MNLQQMTHDTFELDNSTVDNTFSSINIIPDQSADIFAAVLGHDILLPDDREKAISDRMAAYKNRHHKTRRMHLNSKTKTLLAKQKLACLQEEHALWLK